MNQTKYSPCVLILGLGGCPSEMKQSKVYTNLCLTDSLLEIASVDTARLHDVTDKPVLNGRVTFSQEQAARTYPMFDGTVVKLHVETGDYVRERGILAVIHNGEMVDYEKQMKEVNQQVIITHGDMDATQDMFDSGLASDKDILQMRQELANAEAEGNRAREIFSINHFSGRSFYEIKSPVSGLIVDRKVSKDMQPRFDQSEEILTVSGLENVWMMADVYESDISRIVKGTPVYITTLAYLDKVSSGSIGKVYHILDIENKTVNVRIKLCSEDCLLKPDIFTNVDVEYKSSGKQMPRTDAHALIFEGGKNYVVAVATDRRLSIKEVDVYRQLSKECYVRSGPSEGDGVLNQNVSPVYNVLNAD